MAGDIEETSRTLDLVPVNCSPFIFVTFLPSLPPSLPPPPFYPLFCARREFEIADCRWRHVQTRARRGSSPLQRGRKENADAEGREGREGRKRQRESRGERGKLAKGCKTSEKEHQESVKCANHGAVIGGNYDNSIPRARAVVRADARARQRACERAPCTYTRAYTGCPAIIYCRRFLPTTLPDAGIGYRFGINESCRKT